MLFIIMPLIHIKVLYMYMYATYTLQRNITFIQKNRAVSIYSNYLQTLKLKEQ